MCRCKINVTNDPIITKKIQIKLLTFMGITVIIALEKNLSNYDEKIDREKYIFGD